MWIFEAESYYCLISVLLLNSTLETLTCKSHKNTQYVTSKSRPNICIIHSVIGVSVPLYLMSVVNFARVFRFWWSNKRDNFLRKIDNCFETTQALQNKRYTVGEERAFESPKARPVRSNFFKTRPDPKPECSIFPKARPDPSPNQKPAGTRHSIISDFFLKF